MGQAQLRVVIAGHVDHGKSTLVGRLLHETDNLPEGRYESVQRTCKEDDKPFEYAFLLDALAEERRQGITIDTAQVWLRRPERDITIFDAPGHVEFVKNMVCGAASADAALVLVDAEEGVRQQSRRHGHLLGFLGVKQVAVVVNKMDKVGWDRARFEAIEDEYRAFLERVAVRPGAFIPISARDGDNVTLRGDRSGWYRGPTVIEALEAFRSPPPPDERPLRFTVQDVYKFDDRRIVAGRVESGTVRVGDRLLFSPSDRKSVVKSIERWSVADAPAYAKAGESVGLTLEDPIFIERGEIGSHEEKAPVETDIFAAKVFWMGREPLKVERAYAMRLLNQEVPCRVVGIERLLDASTLEQLAEDAEEVPRNETAEVTIRADRPLALDPFVESPGSGRFVIVDGHDVCGGGTVSELRYPDQRPTLHPKVVSKNIVWDEGIVERADREQLAGHRGAIIWMTGLSGAGKSTLSKVLELKLHRLGLRTFRLDGDNVRHGLNADLGFDPDDRAENIRRVAEVARLFGQSGALLIASFISPYRADRDRARAIAADVPFIEVFVDCSIEVCEDRDPKGLYKRARAGKIEGFTGISAPYEKPQRPEVYVNTEDLSPEDGADFLIERLRLHGLVPAGAVEARAPR